MLDSMSDASDISKASLVEYVLLFTVVNTNNGNTHKCPNHVASSSLRELLCRVF